MPTLYLAGQTFGRLTAERVVRKDKLGSVWLCVCECGTEREVRVTLLRNGMTRSCGCLRRDVSRAKATTHGHGGEDRTSGYGSFHAAKARCNRPTNPGYAGYGGRGIRFLFASFEEFMEHIGPRPEGKTLDRIDNNGNYEPGNVRWATPKEQANNRRRPCFTWT